MQRLQQLAAFAIRGFAVLVFGLVLFFPAYKDLQIAYGPVLLALGAALALHRRLQGPWNPPAGWSRAAFLALAFFAPAIVQTGLLLVLRPEPLYDGRFVFDEAVAFAQAGRMPPLTYYPPAQTWWYAAWFKVFGAAPLVAQLSHVPLHALVTALTYGLARRAVPDRARLAALAVAWYPSFAGYVLTTPYYHYLYTAMVVATAWGWLAAMERPRAALWPGLASGLGALTKATQLIAPAQALLFWFLAPRMDEQPAPDDRRRTTGRRSRVTSFLLFLLGMALVIAPWTFRNWRVFDAIVPVCTSGGLVLWSANNPESNGLYSGLPDTADIKTPAEMLAHSRDASAAARRFILENPVRFLQLVGTKLLHTWGGEATFAELINRRGRSLGKPEDAVSLVFFMGWTLAGGLWAAASLDAMRRRLPLGGVEWATAVIVISNAAVYAVFEGGDRHHLPYVPLVIVATLGVAAEIRRACDRAAPSP